MAKILVIFAHPLLEKSNVQVELYKSAKSVQGVTVNDLYERYPDFDIEVAQEKKLLLEHDIYIWQHPLYWYSAPPLLKQWQDLVLEHGWAYGKQGLALAGKKIFQVITSGGSMEAFQQGGYNKHSLREYLRPFERTAELCHMTYWPPYWVPGVHRIEKRQIQQFAHHYKSLLTALTNDIFPEEEIETQELMNHLIPQTTTN